MIFEADSIHGFLMGELKRRVGVNPRYSLRAYARHLGLSPGELSEVLREKRDLSLKSALKVAKAMNLNPIETKQLLHLAQVVKSRKIGTGAQLEERTVPTLEQKQLTEDTFSLIADWYHFAILNLLDLEGFKWHSGWIAKRLGLTPTQAKMAMDLLLRLGIVKQMNGRYKGAEDFVLSPSGVPSEAVRSYHRQMLTKAIESLELQATSEREITGVGFAVDTKDLSAIKKEISDFQDQLSAKYSKGKRQEVYFLEIAWFRLTQGRSE